MKRDIAALSEGKFDIAIIGGGILGAGIARDAALRGLSVALVEQADFASGTSSRSTKLVHGGLRYLEHFAFRLVAEACRERRLLLELAPHLVRPLSFLLPVYAGDARSLSKIRLGATLYDWLTPRRGTALPAHRVLSANEAVAAEDILPLEGLRGAVLFYDCQMDDARLCIETIADAARHGAVCANYCRVTGFVREHERLMSLQAVDRLTDQTLLAHAKVFINAGGPWVERVAQLGPPTTDALSLSPTKGVHLVIPRVNATHGIYFQSRDEGRMIFLLPWDDASLLGTTDTEFKGDPSDVRVEAADVDYLLGQLRQLAPDACRGEADVIASFAGVRALVRSKHLRPSSRSREERIVRQGDNLLNVAGGKYTTFRAISEKVVNQACRMLRVGRLPCKTHEVPLPDQRSPQTGDQLANSPVVYATDVQRACEREMAVTLSDLMRRRTRLALSRFGGEDVADRVATVMAEKLGWDEATRRQMLADYLFEVGHYQRK